MQNKQSFKIAQLTNVDFEIEQNIFTGKIRLKADGNYIACDSKNKKLFVYTDELGNRFQIYIKPQLIGFGFNITVNNEPLDSALYKYVLKPYEIIVASLPLILLLGGAIGGGIGVIAVFINMSIFKKDAPHKMAKVIGVILLAFIAYFIISLFVLKLIKA